VKPWIVNASPLILLGKINLLELLSALPPSFSIPHAVSLEILAGPDTDPAKIWLQTHGSAFVIPDSHISPEILSWDLGAGETAVISLALALNDSICVLDDLAARNCAEVFQVPVIGTLGILLKAKIAGLIPALKPEVDRLVTAGSMLSTQIIHEALHLARETS
jgi:predicted nucleic acid-binding protein